VATSGEAEAVLAQVAQQPDRGLFAHQPEGGPRITALDSRDVLGGLGGSGEVVGNMQSGRPPG